MINKIFYALSIPFLLEVNSLDLIDDNMLEEEIVICSDTYNNLDDIEVINKYNVSFSNEVKVKEYHEDLDKDYSIYENYGDSEFYSYIGFDEKEYINWTYCFNDNNINYYQLGINFENLEIGKKYKLSFRADDCDFYSYDSGYFNFKIFDYHTINGSGWDSLVKVETQYSDFEEYNWENLYYSYFTDGYYGICNDTLEIEYSFIATTNDLSLVFGESFNSDFYYNVDGEDINFCFDLQEVNDEVDNDYNYFMSLPVFTSVRLTKEYLLNSNIFSVIDDFDGDITDSMEIVDNDVDYDNIGLYSVLLKWSDSSDNSSYFNLYVLIGDFESPTYELKSESYTCSYTNFNIQDVYDLIKVKDNYSDVVYSSSEYSFSIIGSHNITIYVSDSSGNVTEIPFVVNIIDDVNPTIYSVLADNNFTFMSDGCNEDYVYSLIDSYGYYYIEDEKSISLSIYIDDKLIETIWNETYFWLLNGRYASDNVGLDIDDGTHYFKVIDNYGNCSGFYFLSDINKPEVSISSRYWNSLPDLILNDDGSGIKSFIINKIVIDLENSVNKIDVNSVLYDDVPFSYFIINGFNEIYAIQDSVGNVNNTSYCFYFDDIAPVYCGESLIKASYNISVEEILSNLEYYDNLDDNDDIKLELIGSNIKNEVGYYSLSFKLTDTYSNSSIYSINVEIVDIIAPVIMLNSINDFVKVAKNVELSYLEIFDLFKYFYSDVINFSDESLIFSYAIEYENEENYKVLFFVNDDGIIDEYELSFENYDYNNISVRDDGMGDDDSKDNWFVSILKWIWNLIKKFFSWIGSLFSTDEKFVNLI